MEGNDLQENQFFGPNGTPNPAGGSTWATRKDPIRESAFRLHERLDVHARIVEEGLVFHDATLVEDQDRLAGHGICLAVLLRLPADVA